MAARMQWLQDMRTCGAQPQVTTHRAVNSAGVKGTSGRALQLLQDLQTCGALPSVVTHSAAISAYV